MLLNVPNSQVVNNVFEGSGAGQRWGALAVSGADIRVENNDFSESPTGIHLFGGDHYFPNWPTTRPATYPGLIANWFTNVSRLVQIQPGVTGLRQQDTRTPPFAPEFRSIARTGTPSLNLNLTIRSWHGVPTTLESSTNVHQHWALVVTNNAALPGFEVTEPISPDTAQRFYRLRSGK